MTQAESLTRSATSGDVPTPWQLSDGRAGPGHRDRRAVTRHWHSAAQANFNAGPTGTATVGAGRHGRRPSESAARA